MKAELSPHIAPAKCTRSSAIEDRQTITSIREPCPGALASGRSQVTMVRFDRLGEGDVNGVVCADVVSQLPRTTQKIEMGMTMKIEVDEIRDRFVGTRGRDFTGPHETSEALNDFDVHQVRRVEFVVVAKEAASTRAPSGVCRRNSSRADASTTITPTRVPHG